MPRAARNKNIHSKANPSNLPNAPPSYVALPVPPLGSSTNAGDAKPGTLQCLKPIECIPSFKTISPTSVQEAEVTLKPPQSKTLKQARVGSKSERKDKGKSGQKSRRPSDLVCLITQPTAPQPTTAYLIKAFAKRILLPAPQRLLLVLDLNGTLLDRTSAHGYHPRPSLPLFLQYAFANHSVLVWSSARPDNVAAICSKIFSKEQRRKLVGEWGRDTLGLTSAQYVERVQVYKSLDRIWGTSATQIAHPGFAKGERWGQHNTVLIDDSAVKACAQPYNLIQVPQFSRSGKEGGVHVLMQVVGWLEEARKWQNISVVGREGGFKVGNGWTRKQDKNEVLTEIVSLMHLR